MGYEGQTHASTLLMGYEGQKHASTLLMGYEVQTHASMPRYSTLATQTNDFITFFSLLNGAGVENLLSHSVGLFGYLLGQSFSSEIGLVIIDRLICLIYFIPISIGTCHCFPIEFDNFSGNELYG